MLITISQLNRAVSCKAQNIHSQFIISNHLTNHVSRETSQPMIKFIRYFFVLLIVLIVGWIAAYLISNPITIPPFLNATMMMVVPLLLGVFLASRLKASWQVYGIGVLTFIGRPENNL